VPLFVPYDEWHFRVSIDERMMALESGSLKKHFNSPARFCAAGEEREAWGQNHCAPATSLAFWKGISSFCSVSIPSRSLLAVLASYQLREQATLARTLLG
jgi:hypothetical protein